MRLYARFFVLTIAAFIFTACVNPDGTRYIPIQGKVCYTSNGVRYCVGSDGKVILIEGEVQSFKK
jgi:hypothetical protein